MLNCCEHPVIIKDESTSDAEKWVCLSCGAGYKNYYGQLIREGAPTAIRKEDK